MKTLTMSSLILCGALALAQQSPKQTTNPDQTSNPNATSPQTQTNQTGNSDKQTKVTGCLSGSAGSYTISDKSGQTYQLSGDTSKLSEHVGHKVEITGTAMAAGENPTGDKGKSSGAGSMSSGPTLSVSSIKHISEKCEQSH